MIRSIDRPCGCRKKISVSLLVGDGNKTVLCPVDGCDKKITLVKKKKTTEPAEQVTEEQ